VITRMDSAASPRASKPVPLLHPHLGQRVETTEQPLKLAHLSGGGRPGGGPVHLAGAGDELRIGPVGLRAREHASGEGADPPGIDEADRVIAPVEVLGGASA
jgi:hypothetical protein